MFRQISSKLKYGQFTKAIMKLIPYTKLSIDVDADIETVRSKLEPHVEKFWTNGKVWGKRTTFEGQASNTGFKLYRNLKYQNSFFPVFDGEYIACEQGTRINIKARMLLFTNVFMIIFLGGILWSIIFSIFEGKEFTFMPSVIFVLSWVFMCAGFWLEIPKTLKALQRVFE
ncbi:hypothetical protein [Litoribacillus peritrichatus]|uniref:Uncharacterized protein n=1 Tax=Litoribacillus peritrichatus TaxID=718191 RepID=A0ABP7N0Q0_9GAMM